MIILHSSETGLTTSRFKQYSLLSNFIFNRQDTILKLFFRISFAIMHRKSVFAKRLFSTFLIL